MIDGLPLDVLGVGSGWAIVCVLVIMLFRGDIATRREMKAKDKQVDALTETILLKDQTIADFTEVTRTSSAMIAAVLEVAKERR